MRNAFKYNKAVHTSPSLRLFEEIRVRHLDAAYNRVTPPPRNTARCWLYVNWKKCRTRKSISLTIGTVMSRLSRARRRLQD